jgi:hypothetical protein
MDSYAAAEIRSTQVTAISAAERRRQWLRECPKCAQPSHATVRVCLRSSAQQRTAAWLCACSIACACRAAHGSSRSARGAGRWSTAEIRYTRWCAAVTNRTAPVCQPSSPVHARPMNPQSKRCAHPCASYNLPTRLAHVLHRRLHFVKAAIARCVRGVWRRCALRSCHARRWQRRAIVLRLLKANARLRRMSV